MREMDRCATHDDAPRRETRPDLMREMDRCATHDDAPSLCLPRSRPDGGGGDADDLPDLHPFPLVPLGKVHQQHEDPPQRACACSAAAGQ